MYLGFLLLIINAFGVVLSALSMFGIKFAEARKGEDQFLTTGNMIMLALVRLVKGVITGF